MTKKNSYLSLVILTGIILAAAATRLIPHPNNFTPVAAIALFSGAYITNKKLAYAIPLAVMIVSDAIIGFTLTSFFVYMCLVFSVFIGTYIGKKVSVTNIVISAIASSIVFYIVTNFAVWVLWDMYTKDLSGLINCYIMALPFFRNALVGDIVYAGVLFGLYEIVKLKVPVVYAENRK